MCFEHHHSCPYCLGCARWLGAHRLGLPFPDLRFWLGAHRLGLPFPDPCFWLGVHWLLLLCHPGGGHRSYVLGAHRLLLCGAHS